MNILLGVSGSIAAYKAFDLTRALQRQGHAVRVVLTHGALEFVKPEVFRYLGAEAVFLPTDDFNSATPGVPHVSLGKWADLLLLAPTSANTLSKLAQGRAEDFLTSIFLAWRQDRPVLVFPAMNTMMWAHPFTQEHVAKINRLPFAKVVDPAAGLLACGDEGAGKLMDADAIADLAGFFNPLAQLSKHVLITTGATVAPLDPVRFMTNPSSGLTGVALAKAYLAQGAEVTVLMGHPMPSGVAALRAHPRCHLISTPTTEDMRLKAREILPHVQTVIAAAAVADFEFDLSAEKMKKDSLTHLPVKKAVDVLGELLSLKEKQKFISFAAETDTREEIFREKFARKPVDLMVGNRVHSGFSNGENSLGFGTAQGTYWFVLPDRTLPSEELSKTELARKIVQWDERGTLT